MNAKVKVKKDRGHRRLLRRVAGWWLVGCGVVLAAMWVLSALVGWEQRFGSVTLHVARGVVVVRRKDPPVAIVNAPMDVVERKLLQRLADRQLAWLQDGETEFWWWRWHTGPAWYVGAPVWSLSVACGAAGFGLLAWGWNRRLRGACVACGYDARGLSRCPECGVDGDRTSTSTRSSA